MTDVCREQIKVPAEVKYDNTVDLPLYDTKKKTVIGHVVIDNDPEVVKVLTKMLITVSWDASPCVHKLEGHRCISIATWLWNRALTTKNETGKVPGKALDKCYRFLNNDSWDCRRANMVASNTYMNVY